MRDGLLSVYARKNEDRQKRPAAQVRNTRAIRQTEQETPFVTWLFFLEMQSFQRCSLFWLLFAALPTVFLSDILGWNETNTRLNVHQLLPQRWIRESDCWVLVFNFLPTQEHRIWSS